MPTASAAPAAIHYYFAPQSPWTYLGHARFVQIAAEAGATVQVRPVDLGGQIFPVSGGLPLAKRAPQRQAYRLLELRRFADWLGVPLVLQPKYFPVAYDDAALLIVAADAREGTEAALGLTGRVLAACWAEERNIASERTLAELLAEAGLPAALLAESRSQAVHERYLGFTQQAIDAGVFGAPSYVVGEEIFWGQDRLDFLARRLGLRSHGA
jgi:2-hydroxychromene-2-carboxylate isomerase